MSVSSIATPAQQAWSSKQAGSSSLFYVEISDVDVTTGCIGGKEIPAAEAPGRARRLIHAYDVLVSTVRPERKGVGLATSEMDRWIASTGFSLLRAKEPSLAGFLCAVLRHKVSTLQMMRWNTGATYPAMDEDVPLKVLIPDVGANTRKEIGMNFERSIELLNKSKQLIGEAKSDIEALIEGQLDVDGILTGRLQPPTWEDIEV